MRQGETLDVPLIFRELTPLAKLKEQPEIVGQLRELMHNICSRHLRPEADLKGDLHGIPRLHSG